MNSDAVLIKTMRGLLEKLADSRKLSTDNQEIIHDEVAAALKDFPRKNILSNAQKASGKNKRLKAELFYILSEFADDPEVVDWIGKELQNPDPKSRSWLIQIVAHRQLKQFAPLLENIIKNDPDPLCKNMAIWAVSKLLCESSLPILLELAEQSAEIQSRLVQALKEYAHPNCRPYLEKAFTNHAVEKNVKTFAAWGLGKLGDARAMAYLAKMLFDPDIKTPNSCSHGESLRAAQAICEIKGWEFIWNKSFVEQNRNRWKQLLNA
jgi:hypothetical protein